ITQKSSTLGDLDFFFFTEELVNQFFRGGSSRRLKTDQFLVLSVICKKLSVINHPEVFQRQKIYRAMK
ncbi:hypothetical protein KK473_27630, partial [Klebsiella pneumoniae]|uniref:hypothetical protein n=1 Tax=Klebsiella pneumoniae TaxID=573 RepID=UPI001BE0DE73